MLTLPIGFIFILVVTGLSLDTDNLSVYLNMHSFILVFLGTFAVTLFSIPRKDLILSLKALKGLMRKDNEKAQVKADLINLSKNKQEKKLNSHAALISYASDLWTKGIDPETFETLIYEKHDELNATSELPVSIFKNLAKYPPALGMTGTVMGMIALFANLNVDNKAVIGQSLALAMSATFYGLIFANMFLLPLADRLHIKHLSVMNRNEIILSALIKINSDEPTSLIENVNLQQDFYEQAG